MPMCLPKLVGIEITYDACGPIGCDEGYAISPDAAVIRLPSSGPNAWKRDGAVARVASRHWRA